MVAVAFILYAADKERRLADLKSDFIANVSHELKTPLSVIRMFGEMMLTKRVGDESKQQEYLEIICSESERLSGLIENVLDFAALDRGKRRYEMKSCDVADLARRAIDTLHYRFEREGIDGAHVAHRRARARAARRAGDPARDHQLARQRREVRRRQPDRARGRDAAPPRSRCACAITAPASPKPIASALFERFYRGKSSRGTRGSGIGLAIVKRIAEEHHGRAFASNAESGGAIVGFAIPRRDPTGVQSQPGAARDAKSPQLTATQPVDIVARDG